MLDLVVTVGLRTFSVFCYTVQGMNVYRVAKGFRRRFLSCRILLPAAWFRQSVRQCRVEWMTLWSNGVEFAHVLRMDQYVGTSNGTPYLYRKIDYVIQLQAATCCTSSELILEEFGVILTASTSTALWLLHTEYCTLDMFPRMLRNPSLAHRTIVWYR